jgi:hypothetical protein
MGGLEPTVSFMIELIRSDKTGRMRPGCEIAFLKRDFLDSWPTSLTLQEAGDE